MFLHVIVAAPFQQMVPFPFQQQFSAAGVRLFRVDLCVAEAASNRKTRLEDAGFARFTTFSLTCL